MFFRFQKPQSQQHDNTTNHKSQTTKNKQTTNTNSNSNNTITNTNNISTNLNTNTKNPWKTKKQRATQHFFSHPLNKPKQNSVCGFKWQELADHLWLFAKAPDPHMHPLRHVWLSSCPIHNFGCGATMCCIPSRHKYLLIHLCLYRTPWLQVITWFWGWKLRNRKWDVLHGFAACPSQGLVFGWVGGSLVLGWVGYHGTLQSKRSCDSVRHLVCGWVPLSLRCCSVCVS